MESDEVVVIDSEEEWAPAWASSEDDDMGDKDAHDADDIGGAAEGSASGSGGARGGAAGGGAAGGGAAGGGAPKAAKKRPKPPKKRAGAGAAAPKPRKRAKKPPQARTKVNMEWTDSEEEEDGGAADASSGAPVPGMPWSAWVQGPPATMDFQSNLPAEAPAYWAGKKGGTEAANLLPTMGAPASALPANRPPFSRSRAPCLVVVAACHVP
jgi:hypothetical protein